MNVETNTKPLGSISILVLSILFVGAPLFAHDVPQGTTGMTQEAVRVLEQARSSLERGDYQRAVMEYERFIKLVPGRADAHYRRGLAYYHLGNLSRAIQDYSKAIEINPQYVEAYHHRGTAYLDEGNSHRAILDFDRAIKLRPYFAEAYNNRGAAHLKLGNQEMALKDFTRATELDPKFAEAYYNRGTLLTKLDVLSQSIKDLDTAIELKPDYAAAYTSRAFAHGKVGNKARESEDYARAAELSANPRKSGGIAGSMSAYGGAAGPGRESSDVQTIDLLRKDLEKTRELEEIKKRLDDLSGDHERLKKELAALAAVKEREPAGDPENRPTDPSTYPERLKKEAPPAAAKRKTPAADTEKTNSKVMAMEWFKKGYASAVAGNYREAIESYDRVIELNPDMAEAYYVRGVAYNNLGDPKQAITDLDRAIELKPEYASAYYNRGLALTKLGNTSQALENYKTSARLGFKQAQDNLKKQGVAW